jgi:hypothetical protein
LGYSYLFGEEGIMTQKTIVEKMTLRTVAELKLKLAEAEEMYNEDRILDAQARFQNILEASLRKIASGACGHAPTWAYRLIETGIKIGFFEE